MTRANEVSTREGRAGEPRAFADETVRAMGRLQAVLWQHEELRDLLLAAERLALAAAAKAGAQAEASGKTGSRPHCFLFVCAERLMEIASGAARGAQALPAVTEIPGERAEWLQWIQSAERAAGRTAAASPELARLSMQTSLLALESELVLAGTSEQPAELAGEISRLADLLRETGRRIPAQSTETVWAAREAAGQCENSKAERLR